MDIEKLKQLISPWSSALPYRVRIYFFGSRFTGKHKPESDYDFAVQLLDSDNNTLTWMDYHESWQHEISKITGLNIHLLLYDIVKKSIKENPALIFESQEARETDDEDFEKDLAALLKKE
mgnify:CR=1 FL=1